MPPIFIQRDAGAKASAVAGKLMEHLPLSQYVRPVYVKERLQQQVKLQFRVAGAEGEERIVHGDMYEEMFSLTQSMQPLQLR